MRNVDTNPGLAAGAEWFARFCALAVAMLGIAVLLGWALHIAVLKSVLPGWATMKANTALAFVLAGGALAAITWGQDVGDWRKVHIAIGLVLMVIALLTLGEYLFGVDFGIDQLLVKDSPETVSAAPPGRMALATALGFAFAGLALVLLDSRRARWGSQAAAIVVNLIGVLAILGYGYGVAALYGVGAYSSMALHTAAGLVVMSLGALAARPHRGLMAILTSNGAGGVLTRRLLPLAIVVPFLIGRFSLLGLHNGHYDAAFGDAWVALASAAVFTAFIWWTADVLRHGDQRRAATERARERQKLQLTGIIESAMDAIIMVDAEQRVALFNPAAEKMFGHKSADVLGGPLDTLLPQRFRAAHLGHIRSFGATGATHRRMGGLGAITGLRANGEEFPIEAAISQLEADGKKYFTVILRDITENRRAQEALRESEERFRAMADAAPVLIWVSGPDRLRNWFNQRWLDFTGRSMAQEVDYGWTEGVHPDDLPERLTVSSETSKDSMRSRPNIACAMSPVNTAG